MAAQATNLTIDEMIDAAVERAAKRVAESGAIPPRRFATPREAGERLGDEDKPVKESTLATWRCRNVGPPWTGSGRFVRYEFSKLDEWLAAQPRHDAGADNDNGAE